MPTKRYKVIPVDKPFFDLSGGFHTESSPLNFPDNVTLDEENFEMLTDKTRRRRRGLNYEDATNPATLDETYNSNEGTQSYTWRNVDNNPDTTLIVLQLGSYLYFYYDDVTLNNKRHPSRVNLGYHLVDGTPDDALATPLSFTHGRGRLFVANKELDPLVIEYKGADEDFSVARLNLQVRPFDDIDDTLLNDTKPISAYVDNGNVRDLSNAHEFNLRNRGWIFGSGETGAENFAKITSTWPSRQMIPYAGYYSKALTVKGEVESGNEEDTRDPTISGAGAGWFNLGHIKGWSTTKIDAEIFGNSFTPRGSFIINIFDNEHPTGAGAGDSLASYKFREPLSNISAESLASEQYTRAEIAARQSPDWPYPGTVPFNARVVGDGDDAAVRYTICLKDILPDTIEVGSVVSTPSWTLEHVFYDGARGTWDEGYESSTSSPVLTRSRGFVITEVDLDNNTFSIDAKIFRDGQNVSKDFYGFRRAGRTEGESRWIFSDSGSFSLDNPVQPTTRPRANAWYAGRLFHAGMQTKEWSDTIFFSKTVLNDNEFGMNFQAADPTHPELNSLVATDGGTIQIPNVGNVIEMRALESSLLVFSDQGVWEISGSNFFSATDIRIRQITSAEAVSPAGIVSIDNGIVYTSHRGIYLLARSGDASGAVVSTNIIAESVQTYWNELTYEQQTKAQLSYDESKGRIYVAHNSDNNSNRRGVVLIFDLRIGGWFKYTFSAAQGCYIVGLHSTDQSSQPDEYQKMKFFIVGGNGTELNIADFSKIEYTDFCGTEQIPFLLTGYDNLGDFSRKRAAPTIYTYLGRTEEGNNEFEDSDRTSACTLQARWDFATGKSTGKFGHPQEVYRKPRPTSVSESGEGREGYEVLLARNAIRGRGRVLQLKFEGSAGKDCHLLGFAIHYKVYAEV